MGNERAAGAKSPNGMGPGGTGSPPPVSAPYSWAQSWTGRTMASPWLDTKTTSEVAYYGTLGIWAVGERILTFRDIRSGAWRSKQDRWSALWVVAGVVAGLAAGLGMASAGVATLSHPLVWLVVGLIIAWTGLVLRAWAVITLGRSFTTVVQVRQGQHVVSSGPYRIVRHPCLPRAPRPPLGPRAGVVRPVERLGHGGAGQPRAGPAGPRRGSSLAGRARSELRRLCQRAGPTCPWRVVKKPNRRGGYLVFRRLRRGQKPGLTRTAANDEVR